MSLQKIHTYTAQQRKELDPVLKSFWQRYQQLKAYQQNPDKGNKEIIIEQFDEICDWQTQWMALQKGLDKLRANRKCLFEISFHPFAQQSKRKGHPGVCQEKKN